VLLPPIQAWLVFPAIDISLSALTTAKTRKLDELSKTIKFQASRDGLVHPDCSLFLLFFSKPTIGYKYKGRQLPSNSQLRWLGITPMEMDTSMPKPNACQQENHFREKWPMCTSRSGCNSF
jgi:hypothetical protein